MSKIVLSTLNARYIHSAFGLRYLRANLGELRSESTIVEFEVTKRPLDIVEALSKYAPSIIGFGVYIWNIRQTTDVIHLARKVLPHTKIILGGPEVSFESEQEEITRLADYVITGEADIAFKELCEAILSSNLPQNKFITAKLPDLHTVALPYDEYTNEDLQNRVVYVEASRGCPFTCEFCLSSLDIPVRQFELQTFLQQLEKLLLRGARTFKFVDRTFNLNFQTSLAILQFFLDRYFDGLFVHFEMVPDRLPEKLRAIIAKFPKGALQFEVGIQSFNPVVGALIKRKQNLEKISENITFLRKETGVHIHADLIVGLPGESLDSFKAGFNQLVRLDPQEIQIGILKRLKGTPISRHDIEFQMKYSPFPPYELLSNNLVPFEMMQQMGRLSRYWDLIVNSGSFLQTQRLLLNVEDPFESFMSFTTFLYEATGARHGFSTKNLATYLFQFLMRQGVGREEVQAAIKADFKRLGRKDLPLECFESSVPKRQQKAFERQQRHLASGE